MNVAKNGNVEWQWNTAARQITTQKNTSTRTNIAHISINNPSTAGNLCSSLKHLTVNAAPPPAPKMWRHVKMAKVTADIPGFIAIFIANIQW